MSEEPTHWTESPVVAIPKWFVGGAAIIAPFAIAWAFNISMKIERIDTMLVLEVPTIKNRHKEDTERLTEWMESLRGDVTKLSQGRSRREPLP